MKIKLALVMCVAAFSSHAADIPGLKTLNIGDAPPPFSLPGIDGKTHTLDTYKDAEILALVFTSNHCPDAQAAEQRLVKFVNDFKAKGVVLVAINPNSPDGLRPDELGYSKYNDGFEDMKLHAAEQEFNFPYLYDGEKQITAKAYGCLATPHVFIFDQERKLRYKGQFDDSRFAPPDTVKSPDAQRAVEAILAGKPIQKKVTRPHGCSTKWLEKKAAVAADHAYWNNPEVTVETIDAAGVAGLVKNGSGNYRLFNVWATWCSPCVAEFPELAKTSRRFGLRNFEFISISLDTTDKTDSVTKFLQEKGVATPKKVKKFLKKEGRTTNNYIYTGESQDALVEALDPEWPGPIPHTVLVDPSGKIIWRHNGIVDDDELRGLILDELGRYWVP